MGMIVRGLLSLIFCFCCVSIQAQTIPSVIIDEEEEVDTVYMIEEPLVVEKSLVIHSEKTVKFYLSGYAAAFSNFNYYIPCEGYEERLTQYKATIDPSMNYSAGITLSYSPNKIIFSGGLDYSAIREKFEYTDNDGIAYSSNNQFNYLDLSLTAGYWMGRENNRTSLIVSGGASYNHLLSQQGMIYDAKNKGSVIDVASSEKLRPGQYSLTVSCKLIFKPQSRMKYNIEPYYMGSIATITQDKYPYLQYYNRVGIRFGIMFSI